MSDVLTALAPFKETLEGVVVESTYNWYWLVDGLEEEGYKVHLANPSAMKQYEGLKHTDDQSDAFWLAHMTRLGILPEGYIYPKEERAIRDLLRAAEKINYPILLVSRPGHCVAAMASYNQYKTLAAPCARADIRRNFGTFIIFSNPWVSILEVFPEPELCTSIIKLPNKLKPIAN